jgi:hypothetical protein
MTRSTQKPLHVTSSRITAITVRSPECPGSQLSLIDVIGCPQLYEQNTNGTFTLVPFTGGVSQLVCIVSLDETLTLGLELLLQELHVRLPPIG